MDISSIGFVNDVIAAIASEGLMPPSFIRLYSSTPMKNGADAGDSQSIVTLLPPTSTE